MADNYLGTAIPQAKQPKGMGSSARNSAGPVEDKADKRGDAMRPLKPSPISPRHNGGGHMGSWADKEHPMKGRR